MESELEGKDWDLYTKARYLYLRSCELFTYDLRYSFAEGKLKREIFHRKFSLEDVNDFRVVCSSWVESVYLDLLEKILNVHGESRGKEHRSAYFSLDQKFIADACLTSDLSRGKLNFSTNLFYPISEKRQYQGKLKEIDQKIQYINEDYFDNYLKVIFGDRKENTIDKLYKIKILFENNFKELPYYDARFFLSYVLIKFLSKNIEQIDLYDCRKEEYDFFQITSIHYEEDYHFLLLEENKKSKFLEITESDKKNYLESYKTKKKSGNL